MDVVLVPWPSEEHRLETLRRDHRPRLLLVEGGAEPPLPADCVEDWIRIPVDEADLHARAASLSVRAVRHGSVAPRLDDGVLRAGGTWVSLPPMEARLTQALLDRIGTVVTREALARAGWPGGAPGRNALDVHVLRLRRRLAPTGLVIRTVRSRGYLLEMSEASQDVVEEADLATTATTEGNPCSS